MNSTNDNTSAVEALKQARTALDLKRNAFIADCRSGNVREVIAVVVATSVRVAPQVLDLAFAMSELQQMRSQNSSTAKAVGFAILKNKDTLLGLLDELSSVSDAFGPEIAEVDNALGKTRVHADAAIAAKEESVRAQFLTLIQ